MHSKHQKLTHTQSNKSAQTLVSANMPEPDDRYPGSFFRIPSIPIPGKTTWSISK